MIFVRKRAILPLAAICTLLCSSLPVLERIQLFTIQPHQLTMIQSSHPYISTKTNDQMILCAQCLFILYILCFAYPNSSTGSLHCGDVVLWPDFEVWPTNEI